MGASGPSRRREGQVGMGVPPWPAGELLAGSCCVKEGLVEDIPRRRRARRGPWLGGEAQTRPPTELELEVLEVAGARSSRRWEGGGDR